MCIYIYRLCNCPIFPCPKPQPAIPISSPKSPMFVPHGHGLRLNGLQGFRQMLPLMASRHPATTHRAQSIPKGG